MGIEREDERDMLDPAIALEPSEYLKSPTYKPEIPFFTKALNGEEIVEAIEARLAGLCASEFFIAVHWSVLREARDEIETLRWILEKKDAPHA